MRNGCGPLGKLQMREVCRAVCRYHHSNRGQTEHAYLSQWMTNIYLDLNVACEDKRR